MPASPTSRAPPTGGRLLRKSAAAPPPPAGGGRGSPARGGIGRLRAGSPAPAPSAGGAAAAPSAARREIDALIAKYKPAKLTSVDQLVGQYGEQEFLKLVRAKYLDGDPQLTTSPKSPNAPLSGRGGLRSPVSNTAAPPSTAPTGTGRSLSRGRSRASSPAVPPAPAAVPHPPDPAVAAQVACEAGDWKGLVRTARARTELVATLGLVDLAQRYGGPLTVINELCEVAGLPVLAPRPPFVAQRLPASEKQKQPAPTEPGDRRPSPTPEENISETFFAAVAPVEILADRSFDLRITAYIATQVRVRCFVHESVAVS